MKIGQALKMAISSIASNKVRSFLTMLGIIIGVLSVTLLVSLVQGATGKITSSLDELGSSQLIVSVQSKQSKLRLEDLEALEGVGGVKQIAPSIQGMSVGTVAGKSKDLSIIGITESYTAVQNLHLLSGRSILSLDNQHRLDVCVIGYAVAMDLFGDLDIIGSNLRMSGRNYTIVGILEEDGYESFNNRDSNVYIPFTNAQRLLHITAIRDFVAVAESDAQVEQAQQTLDAFMSSLYHDEDAYRIFNMANMQEMVSTILGTLTLLLGAIGGISLLVGGIGIMNIMLVSVTERTKEIGIRKAIGAQRKDILIQFIMESIMISLLGGLMGLLLSMGILAFVDRALPDYQFGVSAMVALVSIGFSFFVGMVFGIHPANKAAKLKPIDALRFE